MTSFKPKPREPKKTQAEFQELLAQAVRNTQPQTEPKTLPKPRKHPQPATWREADLLRVIGHAP
jgi:hypothetical protein